ncbi:MAG: Uncharacterized protein CEN89_153 [Candidatus Berkelbacteria bacterium Licking1014_7]|uniref:Uncharacterized protein n=1 Tax=Candidatus Berkelbacteria bacterium Licking1014_7 TaxID=2017147 RepID=A0A554LKT1_9BACT|nr:MAG: Uncharacterized protein CEN89_153 [Candidatus Berkelbacteria bacterium Licking1014_7]
MKKVFYYFVGIFGILAGFSARALAAVTDLVCPGGWGGIIFGRGACNPPAGAEIPTQFYSIESIISLIFSTIITAAGAIFMIMLIVGGIQYLTGAGNEETTGKAKKLMIDAVIGLLITLSAWAIGAWVLNQFVQ